MKKHTIIIKERSIYLPSETNDCSVIALALVVGCTYEEAHNTLGSLGRLYGTSTNTIVFKDALRSYGYNVSREVWMGMGSHLGNITKHDYLGTVVLVSENHLSAVVDDILEDSAIYNSRRVKFLYDLY